jgi:hypothetical protein
VGVRQSALVGAGDAKLLAQQFLLEPDRRGARGAPGQNDGAAISGAFQGSLKDGGRLGAVEHGFGTRPGRDLPHPGDHVLTGGVDHVGGSTLLGQCQTFVEQVDGDARMGSG